MKVNNLTAYDTLVVNGDCIVKGNLKVTGDITVEGTLTTLHHELEIVKPGEILKCSKCGGTKFYETGNGMIFAIYVENGSAPSKREYRCDKCGNTEWVEYPAVYNKREAEEVILPKNK